MFVSGLGFIMISDEKFIYVYNNDEKILYKSYFGNITIYDITSSWDIAIEQQLIPQGTIGVINNFLEARFDFNSLNDFKKIPEYYQQNLNTFSGLRFAIVTVSPKDMVVPVLVKEYDKGYESRPFSTVEAARQWILERF
ncbi:MAG TPA: hypothetical protein PK029_00370 [Bacteroidales bacterium]|nr:hypothetical protein [Bacteroidales bacterium]